MNSQIKSRTSLLFLSFIILGVYYPAIFGPLNSIDDPGMYSYLLNTDRFTIHSIFATGGGNYYRPILIVSYMMDKYVWGLEESFMHLENVVFHLLNTLLVFAIARNCALRKGLSSGVAPLIVAFFFGIHPLSTEVVSWISGRTDLLAGFFLFLSVWLLLRQSSNYLSITAAALCMLLGCLAKETAIFFLPAALLLPFYISKDNDKTTSIRVTFFNNLTHFFVFPLAGASYFALRTGAFTHIDHGVVQVFNHVGGENSAGLLLNLRLIVKAAGFYLKKLFIPFPLNFGITHVSDFYIPVGILLFTIVLISFIRRTMLSFFVVCAAAIGSSALLIPLLNQTWTPLAERYMYIPSAFFIMWLTFSIYQWDNREQYRPQITVVLCLFAATFIYGTATRAILWQDNLALYQDTLRKSPDFIPAKNEIANALYERGKNQEAAAILLSLQLPDELVNRQYGLISKAAALAKNGDLASARLLLDQALQNPGKHEVEISNRSLKLYDLEVAQGVVTSIKVYPDRVRLLTRLNIITGDPFYLYRLGLVHLYQKKYRLAQTALSVAAARAPGDAYYRMPAQQLSATLASRSDQNLAGDLK
jgi:protein O-mannosyl-transferase